MRLHGLEVRLDDCHILPIGAILADKPRSGRKVVVLLGDHVIDKVPRRLSVQAVHPPRVESFL